MFSTLLLSDALFLVMAEVKWMGDVFVFLWEPGEQKEGACEWHLPEVDVRYLSFTFHEDISWVPWRAEGGQVGKCRRSSFL